VNLLRIAQSLHALRQGRAWRLLAADTSASVLAMLQCLFLAEDKTLPGSVLHERVAQFIDALRAEGYAGLEQAPAHYVGYWLSQGWVERRLPAGEPEEVYELTAEAAAVLRYVQSLQRPHASATESRLANVMQQLVRLAEETDANPENRMRLLQAERERIDAHMQALAQRGAVVLDEQRALERAREVVALAQELTADFRNVRDAFAQLNRGLRQKLLEDEGGRGQVLERIFAGVDVIAESEHGRTFEAFWRLLTDGEQRALFSEALDAVTSREFSRRLDEGERRFLRNLTVTLLNEGGAVRDVVQQFARSLKSFVQSREFQEQRRLRELLRQAQQAALAVRETVRPSEKLAFALTLTSADVRSATQWLAYDPRERAPEAPMTDAQASELTLDTVDELVRQSEIDFRTLKDHVREALAQCSQIRVSELLQRYPAEQGFGSVLGYVALGARHGEVTEEREIVCWQGADGIVRGARVAAIYFTQRSLHGLD
jgi:hypothetical protein